MGPFLIAWLVGMGLNISHESYNYKVHSAIGYKDPNYSAMPPKPGRLLVASGIYVGLAVLAEAPSMRSTATLGAWGYNIAIALRWAGEFSANQSSGFKATGTSLWNPPSASSDVLFPNGAGGTPTAKPTAGMAMPMPTTGPGTSSGTLVA